MIDPSEGIHATPALTILGTIAALLLGSGIVALVSISRNYRDHPTDWQLAATRLRARPWLWRDLTLVVLVVLLVGALTNRATPCEIQADNGHVFLAINVIFQLAAVVITIVLARLRGMGGRTLVNDGGQPTSTMVLTGIRFYFATLPILVVVGAVWFGVLNVTGVETDRQVAVQFFLELQSGWHLLGFVLVAVVLAPLVEELFFRGLLLPLLLRKADPIMAIVIGAVAFALVHHNLAAVAPLFALAVCMSVAYLACGSLLVPIVMHAMFNGVSLLLLWLGKLAGVA